MKNCCYALFIVLALAALTPLKAGGLSQEASSRCAPAVDQLRYPTAALSARIMGTVWATAEFDDTGAIASIETKGHSLLVSEVEKALRSAAPSSACSRQQAAMQFSFVIDQNLDPKTPVSVKPVSALNYQIVASAELVEVTIADPAWIFTRKGRFLHHVKLTLSKLKFW